MQPPQKNDPFSTEDGSGEDFPILFDEEQDERFYRPLAGRLIDRSGGRLLLVGIAGPPGSGKTTFARLLAWAVDRSVGIEKTAVSIGMDGWHYPNDYLAAHFFFEEEAQMPLKDIKGAPQTFDLQSFLTFIRAIRDGERPAYPLYSRKLHDVMRNAGVIPAQTHVFLFEGNYLHLDLARWTQAGSLFDVRIFIDAPSSVLRSALQKRHLRGGKELKTVTEFIENVDMQNAYLVRERRLPAHILIRKSDEARIGEVRYLEGF